MTENTVKLSGSPVLEYRKKDNSFYIVLTLGDAQKLAAVGADILQYDCTKLGQTLQGVCVSLNPNIETTKVSIIRQLGDKLMVEVVTSPTYKEYIQPVAASQCLKDGGFLIKELTVRPKRWNNGRASGVKLYATRIVLV